MQRTARFLLWMGLALGLWGGLFLNIGVLQSFGGGIPALGGFFPGGMLMIVVSFLMITGGCVLKALSAESREID